MAKRVKAWAVVTELGKFLEAVPQVAEAESLALYLVEWKCRVVPCTIVFDEPKKRAKK